MSQVEIPKKCKELVDAFVEGGWSFVLQHAKDTGGCPYISTEARRDGAHIMVTWHTRATGTYRLFSCMVNRRDVTLTKAMEAVATQAA